MNTQTPRKVTLREYHKLIKDAREERRKILNSGKSLLTPHTDKAVLLKLLDEVFRLKRANRIHLTTSETIGLVQLKNKILDNQILVDFDLKKLETIVVGNQIFSGLCGIDYMLNDSKVLALDESETVETIENMPEIPDIND